MKKFMMTAIVLMMGSIGWCNGTTLDGIAAHVNDAVVTVGEVRDAMASGIPQLKQVYEGAELKEKIKELYSEALDELINAKLIMKAYEDDTKINKDGVDKYVERKISEFIQERFGGDRQEFLKALRGEHLSMEEWRRRMRERVIVGMMRSREVESRIMISPREVLEVYRSNPKKYYREERVKLRVILIHGSTNLTDRVVREASATNALASIVSGSDFADLARKLSEDGKAESGGDWGWVETRDLRPELAAPVKLVSTNAVSGVITMDGDFYLVKVEDRQPAGPVPFEDVRTTIERELRRKDAKRLMAVWMEQLRKDAFIQIVENANP